MLVKDVHKVYAAELCACVTGESGHWALGSSSEQCHSDAVLKRPPFLKNSIFL